MRALRSRVDDGRNLSVVELSMIERGVLGLATCRLMPEALRAERWPERAAAVAALIRPGERVLDLGAGACGLRARLPAGCSYVATDIDTGGRSDIIEMDLMTASAQRFPAQSFDVAVLVGVIEHCFHAESAIALAMCWGRRVLFTYDPEADNYWQSGWRDDARRGRLDIGIPVTLIGESSVQQSVFMARLAGKWATHGIWCIAVAA